MDERRTLSLNVFLNTLEEGCKNERRYCFILGAGASKTSGIPTGEELAKQWHGEILEQCSKEEIKELKKRLGVRSTKPSSRAYFDLYAMRFFPDYQNGSAFLERTLERAQPSLGYYPLAALLANTRNNLVITTNFDSLVEDALFIYTDKRPIVISHELLAQYINFNTSRPIIAKLHRGLFFDPLNRAEQVNGLSKQWKDILREAFKRYTPVVIGYAGGDHSLMDFLKETECLSGLYWCYRHDEPPEEIQKVVERHSGYFIPIEGFDEMMYLMGQRFGYTDPCEHIESAAEQRVRDYQEQVKAFQEKLRAAETPARPRAPSSGPWTPNSGRSFSGWTVASSWTRRTGRPTGSGESSTILPTTMPRRWRTSRKPKSWEWRTASSTGIRGFATEGWEKQSWQSGNTADRWN